MKFWIKRLKRDAIGNILQEDEYREFDTDEYGPFDQTSLPGKGWALSDPPPAAPDYVPTPEEQLEVLIAAKLRLMALDALAADDPDNALVQSAKTEAQATVSASASAVDAAAVETPK